MLVVTEESTRADIAEALSYLSHRAGRVTVADRDYAAIHASIDELLDAYEAAT